MKLEDQVCSLELAKRLKELGVRQESAFYWSWHEGSKSLELKQDKTLFGKTHWEDIATFTVAELGEMLPWDFVFIRNSYGNWEGRQIIYDSKETEELRMFQSGRPLLVHSDQSCSNTEANARAKMLIYLIEQGIVKP